MESEQLDTRTALAIIHRMGESGLPPEQGIEDVNVGTGSYLDVLDEEYLATHLPLAGGSTFKLVQGTYGAGKTHFLYCLRARARRRGFLTALVTLTSARGECPFDSPIHIYQSCASKLSLGGVAQESPITGLVDIVRHWVEEQLTRQEKEPFLAWVKGSLGRSAIGYQPYRTALCRLIRGLVADEDGLEPLEAWLLGQPVPSSDVRPFGVYEVPRAQNAFLLLRSMVQSVREMGLTGTALLFDEGEKQLSFARADARSTQQVLNNLRETIDLCGQAELPSAIVVYAVTPDFANNVVPRYPALQQRLLFPVQPMSVHSPLSPLIDLEVLDLTPQDLLGALGEKLMGVYRTAYGWAGNRESLQANLKTLVDETLAHQLEVGHRRIFVKAWIRLLDEDRRTGGRVLDAREVLTVMQRAQQALAPDDEDEFEDD